MGVAYAVVTLIALVTFTSAQNNNRIFCQLDTSYIYTGDGPDYLTYLLKGSYCNYIVLESGIDIDEHSGAIVLPNSSSDIDPHLTFFLKDDSNNVNSVVYSIGGTSEASSKRFAKMLSTTYSRDKFLNTLLDFLHTYKVDGVYLDWRNPRPYGSRQEEAHNFVLLLEQLNLIAKKNKFIVMVAVLGRTDKQTLELYNIPEIVNLVDFVFLMFHHGQYTQIRHLAYNAPLNGSDASMEAGVVHWATVGQAPHKLILSIPFFVRTYTMKNNRTIVGSPCKGPGHSTRLTRRLGYMTYGEWCWQANKWSLFFDKTAGVPFAFKDDQWASYENSRSIWAKMHLVKDHNLGGVMAYNFDADDIDGRCGKKRTLLEILHVALTDNEGTTPKPTTETPGGCGKNGFYRVFYDCRLYYECRNDERIDYECIYGQYFDTAAGYCRPKAEVPCDTGKYIVWRRGMPVYSMEDLPPNLILAD